MIIFLIIGAIGLLLVVVSMVLGELVDFGDGTLSGTSLGVGGIIFGASGVITTANNLHVTLTYVLSAVAAIIVIVGVQMLNKRIIETEDGQPVSLVGVTGVAMSDITPTHGEVFLDAPSELERRMAWSDAPIAQGARIVVLTQAGSRVHVVPDA